ncbi:MAG: aldehyde ferredoxin oxidoreductase C-terminal domain-containing protein, partial [Bacillota bacterium]
MPKGYHNRIAHVDLTTGRVEYEAPGDAFFRTYLGGKALVAYYLAREVPPGADPLGPENCLVFAPGVITGAAVSGQGRNAVGALSPLTGGFGCAEGGGYVGAEVKRAGIDAIVVKGRAETPVYLWVHDGQVEIRDARHLWGLTTGDAEDAIRAELGSERVRTALIGPAGENRVRFACVVQDRSHFAGRTGMGAVMGAKNLKGIAALAPVGAGGRMEVADPTGVAAIQKWMGQNLNLVKGLHDLGTAGGILSLNGSGGLPVRNFRAGSWDRAEEYSGERMRDTILVKRDTCAACAVRCKRVVELETPYRVDRRYGGPEYESLSALGNLCGVSDLYALAKANELTAAYGLDSISTGAVIAFAMEAAERGLLGPDRAGGLDLSWGNAETMLALVEAIAFRRGLGDLLAEGVARAARELGPEAEAFALHVKGQEIPMHEPRVKHALGVGYAVSPTGADHMHNMHDTAYATRSRSWEHAQTWGSFGLQEVHGFAEEKMRLFYYHVNFRHA